MRSANTAGTFRSVVTIDTNKIEDWIDRQRRLEAFANTLVRAKTEAGELGLYRTMHALDEATQQVGWELASLRDPEQRRLADKYMRMRD